MCQVTQLNRFREISFLYHLNAFPFFVDVRRLLNALDSMLIVDMVVRKSTDGTCHTQSQRRDGHLMQATTKPEIFLGQLAWSMEHG